MKPTVVIHHDRRYVSSKGKSPVKIKVTFKIDNPKRWVRKFYGDNFYCSPQEFRSLSKPRNDELRQMNKDLRKLQAKAQGIIDTSDDLSIALFESLFFGIALDTVNGGFQKRIENLQAADRIGTAKTYKTAINSLVGYSNHDLRYSEITPTWLKSYELHMIGKGKSINFIGINLRSLRAVFNEAISMKVVPANLYPFKAFKIRSERKFKIPLSEKELAALKAFEPTNIDQAEALDYFKFSYYCNGMNMTDICKLRHSDIQDDFLIYDRSKTRRTVIQFKKIIIPIDHEIRAIISRRSRSLSGYIFPVLDEGLSEVTIKNRVQKFIQRVNNDLRSIAVKCGITKKFTTVIARHTFANRMMNGGVERRIISEALGHQQAQTTEHYLGTMDIEKVKKAREAL